MRLASGQRVREERERERERKFSAVYAVADDVSSCYGVISLSCAEQRIQLLARSSLSRSVCPPHDTLKIVYYRASSICCGC